MNTSASSITRTNLLRYRAIKVYLHKAELRCEVGERRLLAEYADGYG